ncbi:MAG: DUF349 domain-containing protein [Salinivirgaceae bacterium]|nr:DUF349 domain-containing protein [Salinivirgaceae bacterium]
METSDFTNETNQPEKGAESTENKSVEQNEKQNLETQIDPQLSGDGVVSEDVEVKTEQQTQESPSSEKIEEEMIEEKEVEVVGAKTESELESKSENKKSKKDSFEKEDYSGLVRSELLSKLNGLINAYPIETIKDAVEEIKTLFYKKYKAESAEEKKVFVEEGGNPDDFKFSDETSEETFKVLYNQFKTKKYELTQNIENQKYENLKIKYQIIDEIKELINKEESINKTFQEFRDLQDKWRNIGLVPQKEVKNLWETYNHNVEQFYDYININKELRDLDLKKNMELKIKLCENAEALLLSDSVTKAFKTLQEYHNQWREIGPVPRDNKDDLWERFKAATTSINKRHQDYFESLKDQQVTNLEQKEALCEKVEEIVAFNFTKPKDWEDKAQEIIEIQKFWRTIGFAPKKDNNKIYQRFKTGCDEFFSRKRDFYKDAKQVQKNNMQYKLDLCVQAEALKDSTEWKKTTEDFINLQKRWKEIGPVPKKHSELLWKRFRTACDYFFNVKSEFFNTVDSRQEDNLKLKQELIEKIKNFQKADTEKENLKQLMAIQKEWSEIGHVPIKQKDEIQKEFRDAIDEQFEKLKIDISERNKINFKSKVDTWVSSNSRSKLYSERNKLVSKINELENEISLYENNIGFFSKSSNSEALMGEVLKKIELAKERMVALREKLRFLDKADQDID